MNLNLNPKTVILAVVALLIAVGTGILVQGWMKAQRAAMLASLPKAEKQVVHHVRILVARRTMPAGTLIKPRDVEWRAWPEKGLGKTYFVEGKQKIKDVVGAVVRKGISEGEPISLGRVVKQGDRGFMAAVLTPGMRAVAIPINPISGIAGFVFPGDRVDLLLSQRTKNDRTTETLLRGLRILGMDQSTNDQNGKPRIAKTATIEVTPKQAEMIGVAVQLGKLSFSLRSLAARDGNKDDLITGPAVRGDTFTRARDVSIVIGGKPGARPRRKVDVIRKTQRKTLSF